MTLDDLIAYGADVESGLGRCMGNADIYLELVGTVAEEPAFEHLCSELASGDWDNAFATAHSLKGVAGNLALTPLYDAVCDLVELLRPRTAVDYAAALARVQSARENLIRLSGAAD